MAVVDSQWNRERLSGTRSPRVVVHDYSGHPGQAQLSRALAARGYEVEHQHCPSYTTGKGSLDSLPGDPPTLRFVPCPMRGTFRRYAFVRRVRQELAYGKRAGRLIAEARPDVAILSNIPLLAHARVARRLRRRRIPMVFWQQDVYSAAIADAAAERNHMVARAVSTTADRIERAVARRSAAIVPISSNFLDKLSQWGVAVRATVIPNWAPIDELPQLPKRNSWSERHGLGVVPVVLYAGTLGLKHDPRIIAELAVALGKSRPDAVVVVVSEGMGRAWLEDWKRRNNAPNLLLLDYQPYEELPAVLASADLLLAVLEPDASRYSVPSKVLTYLCAGRAVVAAMPRNNSVASVLVENDIGVVVDRNGSDDLGQLAAHLLADEGRRLELGARARHYAETTFPIHGVTDRFESVLESIIGTAGGD